MVTDVKCCTDTDSLLLEIKTEDVYRDLGEKKNLYYQSEYPQSHEFYSPKTIIGKMKDECARKTITKYVGLRG